jgi:UDP-2,3-diacylglucosamine hydrolase
VGSAFFVSDIHISKMASPNGEAFLSLLEKAKKEATLFVILGDLFDLWVGSGSAFQKEYAPIINSLKELRLKCRILYFEGNHDFQLSKFWGKDLGFAVYTGPFDFQVNGIKVHAEHGDEINRDDHGYLFLRWFLRTPPLKFLIDALPSSLILKIGQRASSASREYTSGLKNNTIDIFRAYAKKLCEQKPFDLFVTGHTHVGDDFKFHVENSEARIINLGSWFDGAHYLRISDKGEIVIITL